MSIEREVIRVFLLVYGCCVFFIGGRWNRLIELYALSKKEICYIFQQDFNMSRIIALWPKCFNEIRFLMYSYICWCSYGEFLEIPLLIFQRVYRRASSCTLGMGYACWAGFNGFWVLASSSKCNYQSSNIRHIKFWRILHSFFFKHKSFCE